MNKTTYRFLYYITVKNKIKAKYVDITLTETLPFNKALAKSHIDIAKGLPETATIELKGWQVI